MTVALRCLLLGLGIVAVVLTLLVGFYRAIVDVVVGKALGRRCGGPTVWDDSGGAWCCLRVVLVVRGDILVTDYSVYAASVGCNLSVAIGVSSGDPRCGVSDFVRLVVSVVGACSYCWTDIRIDGYLVASEVCVGPDFGPCCHVGTVSDARPDYSSVNDPECCVGEMSVAAEDCACVLSVCVLIDSLTLPCAYVVCASLGFGSGVTVWCEAADVSSTWTGVWSLWLNLPLYVSLSSEVTVLLSECVPVWSRLESAVEVVWPWVGVGSDGRVTGMWFLTWRMIRFM